MVTIPNQNRQRPNRLQRIYDLNANYLYNKLSPYGTQENSLLNFGPKEPFVYKKIPSKPGVSKLLSKLDSPLLPLQSGADDVVRISKFLVSGRGVLFLGKQLLLQRFQPFNETRIYNPASPLIAAARGVSLGLLGRPTRHIDPNNLLSTFTGGSLTNNKPPQHVFGTAIQDGGFNEADSVGLMRSSTALNAKSNLLIRNPSSNPKSQNGLSINLGGLIGMAKNAIDSFRVVEQTEDQYRADSNAYEILLNNGVKLFRNGPIYSYIKNIHKYTPTDRYYPSSSVFLYPETSSLENKYYDYDVTKFTNFVDKNADKIIYENGEIFFTGSFKSDVDVEYKYPRNKRYYNNVGKPEKTKGDKIYNDMRSINRLYVLSELDSLNEQYLSKLPEGNHGIPFYFHDLVNDIYIPFQTTIKGISEGFQADWQEVRYIGRADKMFNYAGFTRNLSFTFMVHAESIRDLLPMWNRINYFCGLTKPSNYIVADSSNKTGGAVSYVSHFIVPPMVKLTIGDFYKNQPIVIDSINMDIPEDALWETTSEEKFNLSNDIWTYINKVRVNTFAGGSVFKVAQFPRECNLSVQCRIMEKERPRVGLNNWGNSLENESNSNFSDSVKKINSVQTNR